MRVVTILLAICALAVSNAQEKKGLQVKDLPAAVQKTVQDNLMGGAIKHIAKEKENGVEQFEIETILNGKSRDFDVDTKGNLLVVEVATTLDAVPAAAKAAILKKVGGGKLGGIETLTRTGQPTMYEAAYADSNGKTHEVLVKANGMETKE